MENRKRDFEGSQSSTRSVSYEIKLSEATPKHVADYLKSKGYNHEAKLFQEQEISGKVLSDLTEDLLDKKVGVRSLGKRLELLKLFKELEGQQMLTVEPKPAKMSPKVQQRPPATIGACPEPTPSTSSNLQQPLVTPERKKKRPVIGDEALEQHLLQEYHHLERQNSASGKRGDLKQLVTVLYEDADQLFKESYTFDQVYDKLRRLLKNEEKNNVKAATS